MTYKIGKISIDNFKHVDFIELDFYKKDLIVFDGPNGFGKTTLFDAIELVISGKISRVTNTTDGRHGYNDLIFQNKNNRDTVIKIEFYDKEDKFTVVRRFDYTTALRAADRRPDNWDIFELYLLEDFYSPLLAEYIVDSDEIYSKLGLNNFSRYFSLFYYIQQEENTYFLKKSAKDRMSEISQLFDTYNEVKESEKLNKIKLELEKEQRKIDGPNGQLFQKNKLLDTLTLGIKDVNKNELTEVSYFRLLQGGTIEEWDKEDVSVQQTTKELYLNDLRQLYDFVNNFDEFLKSQKNKVVQKYINDKKFLCETIVSSHFINNYDEITELVNKENKLRNLQKILNKESLRTYLKSFPFETIEQFVEREIDTVAIKDKLNLLESYTESANSLSSILQELNTYRDTLMEHFNNIHSVGINNNQSCPLCGHDWLTYEDLVKNVQSKRDKFQKYYDDSSNKYEQQVDLLFIEHLNPIIEWIDEYLKDSENHINQDFYEQLTKNIKRKQNILRFIDWCTDNNIDITPFINQKIEYVSDLEEKVVNLGNFLLTKKEPVKPGYTEFDKKTSEFESLYQDLFEGEEALVRVIKLDDIVNKAKYINYQYYHRSSNAIVLLKNEISDLNIKLINVKLGINKIKRIIEIYKQRIGLHWQQILRDVEIPFYIFSGKILQDYQRGLGLFIKETEGDGVKNIKFVSNPNSDHDAVNYLSSGQLSGLVIAFTLALNKIYGNYTMDILLIDDPVQTMDEINMISFVELLRNEFRNKQIFLSTHEDDTSRYLRYKFSKYNLDTLRFNVKERLYIDS